MTMSTLMQALKPNVDRGDLFLSRFWLALSLLLTAFLIGYLLIIIAKRLIVVINALQAPSRLSTRAKREAAMTDPWSESSKRMSPVVFMPGSEAGQDEDEEGGGSGDAFRDDLGPEDGLDDGDGESDGPDDDKRGPKHG